MRPQHDETLVCLGYGQTRPRNGGPERHKRIRKRKAFQADRTASANLPKPNRIWNVWGNTNRLVWLQGKELGFRKILWKLSERSLEEDKAGSENSFSFSFKSFYLLLNKIPIWLISREKAHTGVSSRGLYFLWFPFSKFLLSIYYILSSVEAKNEQDFLISFSLLPVPPGTF